MSGQDDKFGYMYVVKMRYERLVTLLAGENIDLGSLPKRLRETMETYEACECISNSIRLEGALRNCWMEVPVLLEKKPELEWLVTANEQELTRGYNQ